MPLRMLICVALPAMLDVRCECRDEWWSQDFADKVHFTSDPVVACPDVTESEGHADDEFVVLATDGLW